MELDQFRVYRFDPTFLRAEQNSNIVTPEFDTSENPRDFACFPAVNFERCSPSTAENVIVDCVFRVSSGPEILRIQQIKRLISNGQPSTTLDLGLIEIYFGSQIHKNAPFDLIFAFIVGVRQIACYTYMVQTKLREAKSQ